MKFACFNKKTISPDKVIVLSFVDLSNQNLFFFFLFLFLKFLLDRGSFCEVTVTLCFGLQIILSMSFKIRMDQLSPVLFCQFHAIIPRVISGCQDRASNPDRFPRRQARYHCTILGYWWHTRMVLCRR